MSNIFKREIRYVVLKITDIKNALSDAQLKNLQTICDAVEATRTDRGKQPLECVAIESDWPEYEPVWKMIEDRVSGRTSMSQATESVLQTLGEIAEVEAGDVGGLIDWMQQAKAALSQQEAVGWYTEDHLTDKSATTYDKVCAERWRQKGWPVYELFAHPQPQKVERCDCADKSQCWEPCGELGHSEENIKVSDVELPKVPQSVEKEVAEIMSKSDIETMQDAEAEYDDVGAEITKTRSVISAAIDASKTHAAPQSVQEFIEENSFSSAFYDDPQPVILTKVLESFVSGKVLIDKDALGQAVNDFFADHDNGDGTLNFDHCNANDVDLLVEVIVKAAKREQL